MIEYESTDGYWGEHKHTPAVMIDIIVTNIGTCCIKLTVPTSSISLVVTACTNVRIILRHGGNISCLEQHAKCTPQNISQHHRTVEEATALTGTADTAPAPPTRLRRICSTRPKESQGFKDQRHEHTTQRQSIQAQTIQ